MKNITLITALTLLTACVHESAMPLGNNMVQIDVSAAPVYGRAGAQRIAMENAAKATLKMGYDKFIIVNNSGWNESTVTAGSSSSAGGSAYGFSGSSNSFASTNRHPEAKILVHMFHNGDKGSKDAVDAKQFLEIKD